MKFWHVEAQTQYPVDHDPTWLRLNVASVFLYFHHEFGFQNAMQTPCASSTNSLLSWSQAPCHLPERDPQYEEYSNCNQPQHATTSCRTGQANLAWYWTGLPRKEDRKTRPFSTLVSNQLWSEFFRVESVLYMKTQIEPFFPALVSSCIDRTNPRYLFGWGSAAIGGKTQHRGLHCHHFTDTEATWYQLKKGAQIPFQQGTKGPNSSQQLSRIAFERSEEARRDFRFEIGAYPAEYLVFGDEAAVNLLTTYRMNGWSATTLRARKRCCFVRGTRSVFLSMNVML